MVMPDRQMPRRRWRGPSLSPRSVHARDCRRGVWWETKPAPPCGVSPEARNKRHCGPGAPKLLSSPNKSAVGVSARLPSPQLPSHRPRGSHNRAREAAFYRRLPGSGGRGWSTALARRAEVWCDAVDSMPGGQNVGALIQLCWSTHMMIRHPADAAAVGVRREREVIIIVRRRSSRRPRVYLRWRGDGCV